MPGNSPPEGFKRRKARRLRERKSSSVGDMLVRIEDRCNQNCVFCSFDPDREKGRPGFSELLEQIAGTKERLVQISGGEPFMAGPEEFLKIILFSAGRGKKIEIQTNATLLAGYDREVLKKMIRLMNPGGGYFNVNFPAANPRLDRKITGVALFKERMEGINLLLEFGARVRITHIICRRNYRELPAFSRFVVDTLPRIGWVQFSFVKATGRAASKRIVPKYSAVSPYLQLACEMLEKGGVEFEIDHIPPCMLGRFYVRHVDIGKSGTGMKGPHNEEKNHVKRCAACEHKKICYGPRKDYMKLYGYF